MTDGIHFSVFGLGRFFVSLVTLPRFTQALELLKDGKEAGAILAGTILRGDRSKIGRDFGKAMS